MYKLSKLKKRHIIIQKECIFAINLIRVIFMYLFFGFFFEFFFFPCNFIQRNELNSKDRKKLNCTTLNWKLNTSFLTFH